MTGLLSAIRQAPGRYRTVDSFRTVGIPAFPSDEELIGLTEKY